MVSAQPGASKARYLPHGPFHAELKRRVDRHFAETGRAPNEAPGMVLKTAIILGWFVGTWVLLTFFATEVWQAVGLCVSMGLAMAAIGFNIQHDGNHGGYSKNRKLNAFMAFTLDVMGGSSYVWSWKHNVFHHSNPNVEGLDADIEIKPFARLSPDQPRYWVHRFQAVYIFVLYCFLAVKWHFIDDYANLIIGKVGSNEFPRPKGMKLVSLLAGKAFFITWALIIPMMFHPWWQVLACYGLASIVVSLALAIVFQLAHVLDGATFPAREQDAGLVKTEWAVHQLETSMNFAPKNKLLTWYVGGLNFQVEHHLFPKICHLHLPDIAPIVQQTCKEFGVRYHMHPTFFSALGAHVKWIHKMGQPGSGRDSITVAPQEPRRAEAA